MLAGLAQGLLKRSLDACTTAASSPGPTLPLGVFLPEPGRDAVDLRTHGTLLRRPGVVADLLQRPAPALLRRVSGPDISSQREQLAGGAARAEAATHSSAASWIVIDRFILLAPPSSNRAWRHGPCAVKVLHGAHPIRRHLVRDTSICEHAALDVDARRMVS